MPNIYSLYWLHTDRYPADSSFGELLDWHLTYWNTRPGCSLTVRNPKSRALADFAFAIHIGIAATGSDETPERKLRYWRRGPIKPDDPKVVENMSFQLFGDDPALLPWKIDFETLYHEVSERRDLKSGTKIEKNTDHWNYNNYWTSDKSERYVLHHLRAKDFEGKQAYYIVLVNIKDESMFLQSIEGESEIDLSEFGRVVASGYSHRPNKRTRKFLLETFGAQF